MSKSSSASCFGTLLIFVVTLVAIRYGLPGLWAVMVGLTKGAFLFGGFLFLIVFVALGYFTYKNLRKNKQTEEDKKYLKITRVETLYRSVMDKLQKDIVLNELSPEEMLQAELLIGEKVKEVKTDLVRLYDFVLPKSRKMLDTQIRDYREQIQATGDSAVKQVVQENLKILEEKKQRIAGAEEEIRQKEASLDLIYNSLVRVEEDLRFGRPVQSLLPADLYRRFGLTPPSDRLAPLEQKSSEQ